MVKVNQNIQALKPSATLAINQKVKELRDHAQEVFHFGFGQSPFPIHQSIINVLKENASNQDYLPSLGLESLRKQIQKFLKRHQNVDAHWNNVFVGPGSKELLYQTILILEGTFLIPKGSWVSYVPQIKSKNGKYAILETCFENNFKLTASSLESYCKQNMEDQKTLVLNSPNNPTGAVYSKEELIALAKVCRTYNIIVMSDEIYSQINFQDSYSPSMSHFYPERTIVFGGLSKVFSAGGYRLGFMVLPKDLEVLRNVFRSLFSETFSAVASPVQYAAIEAFKMKPKIYNYIQDCSGILKGISLYVYSKLTSINVACTYPQGAFYMMIGFNRFSSQIHNLGINTSIQLSEYVLKHYRVALLPATDFYFEEDDFFFRLAFVDFDGFKVMEAYKNCRKVDEGFIKRNCSSLFSGIEQLCIFVQDLD